MFPKVAPKFFAHARAGPEEPGQGSGGAAARPLRAPATAPPAENGKGPVRTTITYDVKCNGKTHKVTVAPAQ